MESPGTRHPTTTAPKRPAGLNGRIVLHAVRRRPLMFLGVFALAAAAAATVWFFLPLPKVTAAVVFHVASHNPILPGANPNQVADTQSFKATQANRVKRRLTLSNALKDSNINGLKVIQTAEPDPLSWLDKNITVDSKAASEYMRVTIEGDDGEELSKLLNAVADAYLKDLDEQENGQRRLRLTKLQDVHKGYLDLVTTSQKRIDSIAKSLGSKDGPTLLALESVLREDLRVALRERRNLLDDQQLAERELAGLEAALNPKPGAAAPLASAPEGAVDDEIRKDPAMREFEAEVAKARQLLADTENLFVKGSNPPAVAEARKQLKTAEEKRDKYRTDRRPVFEQQYRDALRRATELRRAEMRTALDKLTTKIGIEDTRVTEIQTKIQQFGEHRLELETLKRNIEQTEKLSQQISEQIEHLKIELNADRRVTKSEDAFVVPGLEGNRRLKYALMVGLGVLAAGFAGLVGWEHRCRRVTHTDEVTADLGVRLLGTVPPLPGDASGARSAASPAMLVEAIDTTRTMLLHGTPGGAPLRTVVVTSAIAREGKTSLTGHLAISLARAGFRTVLIDADFQNPSANRLYDLPDGPGLCEMLRGEADVDGAVRECPVPGLSILPAGRWDLVARQSLVGDRWRQTKQELESRFDFLVIDTAPLLLVSDTLLLAREADGIVLSVLLGVSQVGHVAETIGRLQSVGANVTGAVVNGVWHNAYGVAYGYGSKESGRPEPAGATPGRSDSEGPHSGSDTR